jgi:hypothetical protein
MSGYAFKDTALPHRSIGQFGLRVVASLGHRSRLCVIAAKSTPVAGKQVCDTGEEKPAQPKEAWTGTRVSIGRATP